MAIQTDILVCGSGCAGLGAAVTAARQGAKVLLIERAGFAGGIITAASLPFFDGIAEIENKRIVTPGLPRELMSRLGQCAPDATTMPHHNPQINSIERFKWVADRMIEEQASNLSVLFHAMACDVVMRGSRIAQVRVACKDGLIDVEPRVVIDCTGDGDVAAWSGAPIEKSTPLQPLSLHFRIGNVARGVNIMDLRPRLAAQCEALRDAGEIDLFYGPFCSYSFADSELTFRVVRVAGDASDAADLTRCEMQGRRDAWVMFERWKQTIPEFADAYFVTSGPDIGVRETRRIVGQYVLTEDDICEAAAFDDAIATGCWFLDVHPNRATPNMHSPEETDALKPTLKPGYQPRPYDIPYRTLLPQQVDNLLVAGRCHSATALAASSTRVTCTAMMLGEAAGFAAAMSSALRVEPAGVDGVAIRKHMAANGSPVYSDVV